MKKILWVFAFIIALLMGGNAMAITVNIYYTGENGNARKFAEEMEQSGTVAAIRAEKGNKRYDLHMKLERFIEDEGLPSTDKEFIRE